MPLDRFPNLERHEDAFCDEYVSTMPVVSYVDEEIHLSLLCAWVLAQAATARSDLLVEIYATIRAMMFPMRARWPVALLSLR